MSPNSPQDQSSSATTTRPPFTFSHNITHSLSFVIHPVPGHTYMLVERSTKASLTLHDGNLSLSPPGSKPLASRLWTCETNMGFTTFKNVVSGRYLGWSTKQQDSRGWPALGCEGRINFSEESFFVLQTRAGVGTVLCQRFGGWLCNWGLDKGERVVEREEENEEEGELERGRGMGDEKPENRDAEAAQGGVEEAEAEGFGTVQTVDAGADAVWAKYFGTPEAERNEAGANAAESKAHQSDDKEEAEEEEESKKPVLLAPISNGPHKDAIAFLFCELQE